MAHSIAATTIPTSVNKLLVSLFTNVGSRELKIAIGVPEGKEENKGEGWERGKSEQRESRERESVEKEQRESRERKSRDKVERELRKIDREKEREYRERKREIEIQNY